MSGATLATERSAVTDSDGFYRLAALPALPPAEQRVAKLLLEDARAFATLPVSELAERISQLFAAGTEADKDEARRAFLELLSDPAYAPIEPYKFMALEVALVPVAAEAIVPDLSPDRFRPN